MSDERNPFGGKNRHGLYVPLTETELEVIERLAEAGEFQIVVRDWGVIRHFLPGKYDPVEWAKNPRPLISFGDKRISFFFRMSLQAPAVPQPNWYFDMEVWAMGILFFSQRMPTEYNGRPIDLVAGIDFDWALDVALDQIDPMVVKQIKPGAIGLTTRHGNMRLDVGQQKLLHLVRKLERDTRETDKREAQAVTNRKKKATGK